MKRSSAGAYAAEFHNANQPSAPAGSPPAQSALAIIATNAVPLVGAAFDGWNLWYIVFLYWVEIVAGWIITTWKILLCTGPDATDVPWTTRIHDARSFAGVYACYMAFYGLMVFYIGGFLHDQRPLLDPTGINPWILAITVLLIVVGDFYQFYLNYFARRDARRELASQVQRGAMVPMLVMHFTITLGSIVALVFGAGPMGVIGVLFIFKTGVELHFAGIPVWPSARSPRAPL
jgi:hypothetical protein